MRYLHPHECMTALTVQVGGRMLDGVLGGTSGSNERASSWMFLEPGLAGEEDSRMIPAALELWM